MVVYILRSRIRRRFPLFDETDRGFITCGLKGTSTTLFDLTSSSIEDVTKSSFLRADLLFLNSAFFGIVLREAYIRSKMYSPVPISFQ